MNKLHLEAHPDIKIAVGSIGQEKQPIILVENFVKDAEQLKTYSKSKSTFIETGDYYPGIRSVAPNAYMELMQKVLGSIICNTFKIQPENVSHSESFYSIVATPPEHLLPMQRIPHFDGTNPEDIAFLHYLCDEKYGGTSFYRHRATGFEYVNQSRLKSYVTAVNQETTGSTLPTQYMAESTKLFEKTNSVEAKFNRLIIYRGTTLHSGDIKPDYNFDLNPDTGRLTITSFLYSKS